MQISNKREVILVGGNSHLVIYIWENNELIEFHNEEYKNIIEILVSGDWFVLKYKKNKAKLFRIIPDCEEIDLGGKWDLKIKPFKSQFRTMQLHRFRKNQLIIIDSSYKSKGLNLEFEIFDTKKKESVCVESMVTKGTTIIAAICYSPKFRILSIFDEDKNVKFYNFDKDCRDVLSTGVKLMKEKKFISKGSVTRVIKNCLNTYFVIGTSVGELIFFNVQTLEREEVLQSLHYVLDLMICDQRETTLIYVVHKDTKDLSKFVLEPVLGNLLLDRYGTLNPVYDRGRKMIFKVIFRGIEVERNE